MRQPEWNDEEADEDRPTRTYGYRAALGPDKWASSETAASVFGGGAPSDEARPQSRVRRPRPPQPIRPTNAGPPPPGRSASGPPSSGPPLPGPPLPRPPLPRPPLSGPPPPKPIVLPAPLPAPAPIPIAAPTPIRWVGGDAKNRDTGRGTTRDTSRDTKKRDAEQDAPAPAPSQIRPPIQTPPIQTPPIQTPPASPVPRPAPPPGTGPTLPAEPEPPQLSTHPLRTPAPAVTSIRVLPTPIDGFDYQTASLWFSDALPPAPPLPEPTAGTVLDTYPLKQWRVENPGVVENPVISWLDEED